MTAEVPYDAIMEATAAVICIAFAALLWFDPHRRERVLPLFLVLIGVNQGAESVRALASDPGMKLSAYQVATVAAALDPAAFAWWHDGLRGERASMTTRGLAVGGSAIAMGASVPSAWLDPFVGGLLRVALALITVWAYVTVLVRHVRIPVQARPAGWLPLLYALPVAALLPVGSFFGQLVELSKGRPLVVAGWTLTMDLTPAWVARDLATLLATLLLVGFVLASATGTYRAHDRRLIAGALALGFGVTVAIRIWDVANELVHWFAGGSLQGPWYTVGRAGSAIRWLIFGGLVSVALLRSDTRADPSYRRLASRVLIALALTAVGLLGMAFAFSILRTTPVVRPLDAAILLLVLSSMQGPSLVNWVAKRVYGVRPRTEAHGGRETYLAALACAMRDGRDPRTDDGLARLRRDLGLSSQDAKTLEVVAEEFEEIPLAPGQLARGRYRVLEMLGAGGEGRTFLARDETLDRHVVIKEIVPEVGHEARCLHEARLLASLEHPHVIRVYDVHRRGSRAWLVLAHADAGSLQSRLTREGSLPLREAKPILLGVASALAAAHRHGIVHRDVKPANVLLTSEGGAVLADFGIAGRSLDRTLLPGDVALRAGSLPYMAPEVRQGLPAETPADVWSFAKLVEATVALDAAPSWRDAVRDALCDDPARRPPIEEFAARLAAD